MNENGNIEETPSETRNALLMSVNSRTLIDAFVLLLTKVSARSGNTADQAAWLENAIEACMPPWEEDVVLRADGIIFVSWPFTDRGTSKLWFRATAWFSVGGLDVYYGYDEPSSSEGSNHHTTMSWFVDIDGSAGSDDHHLTNVGVAGFVPFHAAVEALDCATACRVEIYFGDEEDDYEVPAPAPRSARIPQLTAAAVEYLRGMIDEAKGRELLIERYVAPQRCDVCACDFSSGDLLVDGRLRDTITFADMCPRCACMYGSGIGYGDGQLYLRQADDTWLCVAGFPPDHYSDPQ